MRHNAALLCDPFLPDVVESGLPTIPSSSSPRSDLPKTAVIYEPACDQRLLARSVAMFLRKEGYRVIEAKPEINGGLSPQFIERLPVGKRWLQIDYCSAAMEVCSRQKAMNSALIKRLLNTYGLVAPANLPRPDLMVRQIISPDNIGLVALDQPELQRTRVDQLDKAIDTGYNFLIVAPDLPMSWGLASKITTLPGILTLIGQKEDLQLLAHKAAQYPYTSTKIVSVLAGTFEIDQLPCSGQRHIVVCPSSDHVIKELTAPRPLPLWLSRGPGGGPMPYFAIANDAA